MLSTLFSNFSPIHMAAVLVLFVWTGFVRSGLGFGGAALGLPLLLLVFDQPVFWLPIIGMHLLVFSSLTVGKQLRDVDWHYLRRSAGWIFPAALVGVLGLITLPNQWLVNFIYLVTLIYAVIWMMDWSILSKSGVLDRVFLILGGYIAGTSLSGAPLLVAVYLRHVAKERLRNTLFVLWFILVLMKLTAFAVLGVELNFLAALVLLPAAAIGHVMGLWAHAQIVRNEKRFKRIIGGMLAVVSVLGLLGNLV